MPRSVLNHIWRRNYVSNVKQRWVETVPWLPLWFPADCFPTCLLQSRAILTGTVIIPLLLFLLLTQLAINKRAPSQRSLVSSCDSVLMSCGLCRESSSQTHLRLGALTSHTDPKKGRRLPEQSNTAEWLQHTPSSGKTFLFRVPIVLSDSLFQIRNYN